DRKAAGGPGRVRLRERPGRGKTGRRALLATGVSGGERKIQVGRDILHQGRRQVSASVSCAAEVGACSTGAKAAVASLILRVGWRPGMRRAARACSGRPRRALGPRIYPANGSRRSVTKWLQSARSATAPVRETPKKPTLP